MVKRKIPTSTWNGTQWYNHFMDRVILAALIYNYNFTFLLSKKTYLTWNRCLSSLIINWMLHKHTIHHIYKYGMIETMFYKCYKSLSCASIYMSLDYLCEKTISQNSNSEYQKRTNTYLSHTFIGDSSKQDNKNQCFVYTHSREHAINAEQLTTLD